MAPIVSPSGTPCIMYRMPSSTMLGKSWSTVLSLTCSGDINSGAGSAITPLHELLQGFLRDSYWCGCVLLPQG